MLVIKSVRSRVSAVSLALATAFGLLHWVRTFHAIPGETVRFSFVNDIAWDPIAKTMTRTGSDPFVAFELPRTAIPIREVSFVFFGAYVPNEGTYYIFQSTEDDSLVIGSVDSTPGSFVVNAKLQDSTTLRLDLPDFLPRTIEFRRVVIQTPFVRVNRPTFLLTLASLSVAGGSLMFSFVQRIRRKHGERSRRTEAREET